LVYQITVSVVRDADGGTIAHTGVEQVHMLQVISFNDFAMN